MAKAPTRCGSSRDSVEPTNPTRHHICKTTTPRDQEPGRRQATTAGTRRRFKIGDFIIIIRTSQPRNLATSAGRIAAYRPDGTCTYLLFKAHPYVISSLSSLKGRTTTTVFDPFLSRFTPWRHDSACRRICRRHCLSLVGWAGRHGASRRPPPPDTTLWTWPTPWNTSGSSDPRWTTYSACRRAGRQRPAGGARGRCATV
mmetsp:Transcript_10587/g.29165  ORF Transcript_10587/g.29165 Transcript_10587/m.29165 type:complete len:200 (-) Transcript_10587:661-1260(-)